ncbi:HEAT repeat domain-containing protein [Dactylosporangium siamense]|uniref:HEAT repeat domain-containing protein n=1 Tax=Dactylosporangium siamense TaxID=685454 RepID=A0A919U652_9ACTN|nr:hypothetical protein [Dactylosporangium siamense]GIG44064.1 hypothetical protein Dsi01nite_021050 [Dactylosporangium siamense]
MLEGLSGVPWAKLEHAYGPAADVPDLIRALASVDAPAREEALFRLYSNIFHQGTRYQASAYAVPFLLELLASPRTPDRAQIMELLASLAIGYDEAWLPDSFPVASYRERAVGGDRMLVASPVASGAEDDDGSYRNLVPPDESQQEQLFADVELVVYDAVRSGVPLYCALLTEEHESDLRVAAAYALSWFPEDAGTSAGPLTYAAGDPDAAVAATALVALGQVGADDPFAARIVRAALTDDRDLVRWAAAVALARLHGAAAEPAVAAELLAWTAGGDPGRSEIPYLEGDVCGYAGLALRQLDGGHAGAVFDALLARTPAVDGVAALTVVGEALRRAFPAGPVAEDVTFAVLDQPQQRLLRILAENPTTWELDGFAMFGNFSSMVGGYRLPGDAEAMRTFVTGH